MKQIRRGVFETNSSSTHSISIAYGTPLLGSLYVVDGIVTIHPGEFDWATETYNDSYTKASYCYTYCVNYKLDKLSMLRYVIELQTGAKVNFVDNGDTGYIDHASLDIAAEPFESDETLRQFIFSLSSVLETSNDNDY